MRRGDPVWRGPGILLRLECDGRTLHEGRASELHFPILIGRSDLCAWNVPTVEQSVSGVHAEIFLKNSRCLAIRDKESRNGIYCRGAKTDGCRLCPGMQLSIGSCRLCIERIDSARGKVHCQYHRLQQLSGLGAPKVFELKNAHTVIGSGPSCGICCKDLLVSKEHVRIEHKDDDTCWVRDLGSRNGTSVNQIPLKATDRLLCNGDILTVADLEFKFIDRKVPPPDPVWRKVAVAVMTACACGAAYFGYQWQHPSAKDVLKEVGRLEMRERFEDALRELENVSTARGGDGYRDEIARKRADLERWMDTRRKWALLKVDICSQRWDQVSQDLGYLLDPALDRWGWNVEKARRCKSQAQVVYRAVEVFLESRKALGGDMPETMRGHERAYLVGQTRIMAEVLGHSVWPTNLPTDTLRTELGRIQTATKGIVADLDAVDRQLSRIRAPASKAPGLKECMALTENFQQIVRSIEAIAAKNRRKTDAGLVVSPLVRHHCDQYLPVLQKFLEVRAALLGNLASLVSLDVRRLKRSISYPSDQQCTIHPAFGAIRRAMEAANDEICLRLPSALRDQMGRLNVWKLDRLDVPACVAPLLDEDRMTSAFRCDTIQGVYCTALRTARTGAYDTILGIEEFSEFLSNVQDSRSFPATVGELPAPVLSEAIRFYRQADAFVRYLKHPDLAYLLTVTGPRGNRIRDLSDKIASLSEKRMLLVDDWFSRKAGVRREKIIARGAALALDAGRTLDGASAASVKRDLDALRGEVQALKSRLDADPEHVAEIRPRILAIGLPRLMGVSRFWEQERKAGGVR